MSKLSKAQMKAHNQACELVDLDRPLTDDEKEFIARNWHEGANHMNGQAGAHFTPIDLALDFAWDIYGPRVLDLCAGIGLLGLACVWRQRIRECDLVCVEINPDYIRVGKRLLPQATWIQADALSFPSLGPGRFNSIMSNPPFGKSAPITAKGPRYTGNNFDLCLLDLAADHAENLAFIIPQTNAPFQLSGRRDFARAMTAQADQFKRQTGFRLDCGIGVDTAYYRDQWKDVSPLCEIVILNMEDHRDTVAA